MAAITFKCPNCGGELIFDPSGQKYKCEYCNSDFTQQELDQMAPAEGGETVDYTEEPEFSEAEGGGREEPNDKADGGSAVLYSCPSCGAQIVTEETTAATFCYYCHNPVVLEGRLSGEYLPDKIIPFAIDKKTATKQFLDYVGRKKFIPKAFFDESQIEKLSGVYYPYWMYDCRMEGRISGDGTRVRVWRAGDLEYTETSIFRIERNGDIQLQNMSRNALQKSDKALVEGVLPFRMKEAKAFSMGYLSGFLAEKRDIERQSFEAEIHKESERYAECLLRDTVHGYNTVKIRNKQMRLEEEKWRYLLLPVWVLTYTGRNGHIYYYAMNGQTGNICGELPVDSKKLGIFSGILGAIIMILCLIGGYFL